MTTNTISIFTPTASAEDLYEAISAMTPAAQVEKHDGFYKVTAQYASAGDAIFGLVNVRNALQDAQHGVKHREGMFTVDFAIDGIA